MPLVPPVRSASPFISDVAAITESDAELEARLAEVDPLPLLPSLAYMTGDMGLLREHLRPDPLMLSFPGGGFTPEQLTEIRSIALDVLKAYRDGGCVTAPPPAEEDTLRIMEFAMGVAPGDMREYLPLLEEELGHRGEDRRGPQFHKNDIAPDVAFEVLVIGAGMSGIAAGHRLNQAGIPYVIVEKSDGIGGTWYDNTYPGCRVDNPNHNYSYSFAQRHDWPFHYSNQPVLQDYFRRCAEHFGVTPNIRFETEVVSATWSEEDHVWDVVLRTRAGEETLRVNAVISAVGQLNMPSYPDIEGRETYEGISFHSARWDASVDLTGKRVAVIGTGASAMQFIPEIAPDCGELIVFQRTPAWMIETPDYHAPVPEALRWMYDHVPSYSEWNRFALFWRMGDAALQAVRVDPEWPNKEHSVNAMNAMMRMVLEQYLQTQFADRPDLLERSIPNYPPAAKRVIRDNGVWAAALKRDNVQLVTDRIERITPTGIVTADGTAHDVDVLIYGTGFQASNFLTPMQVTGRGGIDLHEHWAGNARAYLGVTIPGFPNLFCLYGPNTNIVINGSIIYFSECGVRYIMGLIGAILAGGHRAVDLRKDIMDAFAERMDAENKAMAWGVSSVNSWYKNANGHVAQNWPFTLLEYWQRTAAVVTDEYDFS